ncbi:hypothetical protein [Paenibacillus sp. DMB20]|uniref:hypothetical protein n=1 Tax=Paenibacillus sp. DMB20 TaxID=1642570 RepID=UPI00069AD52E|nr:hypothetical protein [Paenibacillus sp. DMB20]
MSRWQKHCLLELRLVLGNVFLAALPVLYAGIYLGVMLNIAGSPEPDVYSQMYEFNAFAHTLTLGPAMWLGILTVRRDIRRPSFEWNRSLPVSFHMLLSAKYAVGQVYMILFTIPAAVTFYAVSVAQSIDQSVALRHALNLALQYEISYLVTFALAMLLGVCLQNRMVYLIGFCAWMFGTFFMDIFSHPADGAVIPQNLSFKSVLCGQYRAGRRELGI